MRRMWGFSVEHVSSGNAIGAAHSVVDEWSEIFRLILSPLTVSQISSTDFSTAVRVLVSKRFVCCRIQCARADAAYSWLVAPLFMPHSRSALAEDVGRIVHVRSNASHQLGPSNVDTRTSIREPVGGRFPFSGLRRQPIGIVRQS